jgi:hypothetical protein
VFEERLIEAYSDGLVNHATQHHHEQMFVITEYYKTREKPAFLEQVSNFL